MQEPPSTALTLRVLLIIICLDSFVSFGLAQNVSEHDLRSMIEGKFLPPACATYAQTPIPTADLPAEQDRSTLADCKSEDLYFGFDHLADLSAARKCAYLEREGGNLPPELVFGGSGLLAMIYANGKGATRNFDLALKFSCESVGAPAENYSRFNHLIGLKKKGWTGHDFSLCDDATSGFMGGCCAGLQERFDEVGRNRKLHRLSMNWSPPEQAALEDLRQAVYRFAETSAENEVDLSGTLRAALQIERAAMIKEDLVKSLEQFESGSLPRFSRAQFHRADQELNSSYSKIQSQESNPAWGTITSEGVKAAQREWLSSREAWIRFGQIKYPDVTPESWRTWLTRKRIDTLRELE